MLLSVCCALLMVLGSGVRVFLFLYLFVYVDIVVALVLLLLLLLLLFLSPFLLVMPLLFRYVKYFGEW